MTNPNFNWWIPIPPVGIGQTGFELPKEIKRVEATAGIEPAYPVLQALGRQFSNPLTLTNFPQVIQKVPVNQRKLVDVNGN